MIKPTKTKKENIGLDAKLFPCRGGWDQGLYNEFVSGVISSYEGRINFLKSVEC